MEEKAPEILVEDVLKDFTISVEPEILEKFEVKAQAEDIKAFKKKHKKWLVDEADSAQRALEKFNKLLDEVAKSYETSGKQLVKVKQARLKFDSGEQQKEKVNKNKVFAETVFNSFKKKYDDEIKNAQVVEKEEEEKRKKIIEELQERIKTIQGKYEQTGKIKLDKFRQNQTLKHELSKYEPHLIASESLAEAQLKKKSIQIEIQMTTLKQKIEMMGSFKTMREETDEKLKKSKEIQEKVGKQLKKLAVKEEDHKISLAQYKKAFNVLKVVLPQKEKEAFLSKEKAKKDKGSLQDLSKKIDGLDKEYQTHVDQLDVLKKLQAQLLKQLQE